MKVSLEVTKGPESGKVFEFTDPKFRNMAEAEALFIQIKNSQNPYRLILEESPAPIRENKPDIPLNLATIVDKAVKKDPGQRFQTAAEFRQALLKIR